MKRSDRPGKLFQESDIIVIKKPQIADLVFQHRDAFNAHPESKTGVNPAVDAAIV